MGALVVSVVSTLLGILIREPDRQQTGDW